MGALRKNEFVISMEEGYDLRKQSLALRHSSMVLTYHVFLIRNGVVIHLIMNYERLNHEWTNKCLRDRYESIDQKILQKLKQTKYFRQQNIFQK